MARVSNVRGGGGETPQVHDMSERSAAEGQSVPQQMMEDPNRIERERDAKGRLIGVKVIEWIDSFDVSCIVGPEIADNNRAFGFALATCSVVEIDGQAIARPQTKEQLRALMARLGNAGMNAADKALKRLMPATADSDGGTEAQAIKNS